MKFICFSLLKDERDYDMNIEKFCENINKYRCNLYIMALAILKNEIDAEHVVSSAILKAYENRHQIRVFHKFKPWMLTITQITVWLKMIDGSEILVDSPDPDKKHLQVAAVLPNMKRRGKCFISM